MTRIALIHALSHSVAPINDAFARDWPEARRMNLLDDSLSADLARNGSKGLDGAMHERFQRLAQYAVDTGAQGILFTCSAFGPCIEAVARRHAGIPVLKPNEAMVAEARRRGVDAVHADLNVYLPEEPVAATTLFRALYYARDRPSFFEHVASYTRKKLVFDVNPRQYALAAVTADLRAAGFEAVSARPFFVPQTRALPRPLALGLRGLERAPGMGILLRFRFTLLCSAWRREAAS